MKLKDVGLILFTVVSVSILMGIVSYLGYTIYTFEDWKDKPAPINTARAVMDRATAHSKAGETWLRHSILATLEKRDLTWNDCEALVKKAEEIERRYAKKYFIENTYEYMDANIGLNLPKGYIQSENKEKIEQK